MVNFKHGEKGTINGTLDLTQCTQLSAVEIYNLGGDLKLPSSVKDFVCEGIVFLKNFERITEPIDLSQSSLTKVKIGELNRPLILPSGVINFECRTTARDLDLTDYHSLVSVKVDYVEQTLKLPSSVKHFECKSVSGVLDLSYTRLTSVKGGNIGGTLKLPSTLTSFVCDSIEGTLDASLCANLVAVKVTSIMGSAKLPSVTHFECTEILNACTLDLATCFGLTTVNVGSIKGVLKLPSTVTAFQCDSLSGNLDLSLSTKLTKVKIGRVEGVNVVSLKLPSTVVEFECHNIGAEHTLDLKSYSDLRVAKVQNVDKKGTLLLPANIKILEYLGPIECLKDGLQYCAHLETLRLGNIYTYLQLPNNIRNFTCGQIRVY